MMTTREGDQVSTTPIGVVDQLMERTSTHLAAARETVLDKLNIVYPAGFVRSPFAETEEQLGGLVVIAAKNTEDAVELMSQHPCLCSGVAIEVRPIDEVTIARWEARQSAIKTTAVRQAKSRSRSRKKRTDDFDLPPGMEPVSKLGLVLPTDQPVRSLRRSRSERTGLDRLRRRGR